MDTSQRRWVLKPLSPQLQQSDLRTISSPSPDANQVFHFSLNHSSSHTSDTSGNVEIQSPHVIVSQDGDNTSDEWPSISSSASSSRSASQSGFYSFVDDPTSPEAEMNEAWMVSPQRQAQLVTLKEDSAFKLQTYATNRKPDSIFADDNDESKYSLDLKDNTQVVGEEEERQLRMEIIRNQAPKRSYTEQKRLLGKSDLLQSTNKLIDGFSLTFSPIGAKNQPPQPAEPGTIDEDQINFSAARQQFLKLEQERLKAVISPPRSSRTHKKSSPQIGVKWWAETERKYKTNFKNENTPEMRWTMSPAEKRLSLEDLDSGLEELSLDATGGYNSDDGVFCEKSVGKVPETPIQREIRLAQEREENLRLSRGLKHSSSMEIVEIKTKLVQSPLSPNKPRDKSRVSFFFQKEIQKENQLKEDKPQPLRHIEPNTVKKTGGSESEEFLSLCCPHRHPEESIIYLPHRLKASPVIQSSLAFQMTQAFSSSVDSLTYKQEKAAAQLWRENQETSGLLSRGQGAPDFIEKEIKESLKREQELRELRESRASREEFLTSPKPLVEQANKIAVSQFYPTSHSDKPSSSSFHLSLRQPSVSLVTPQPWTSGSSLSPSMAMLRSSGGLTETLLQDFEERRLKMKLDEGSYAGIQPVDEVNNQVVESTRVIRHKNARALRWEAGVFTNQETQ